MRVIHRVELLPIINKSRVTRENEKKERASTSMKEEKSRGNRSESDPSKAREIVSTVRCTLSMTCLFTSGEWRWKRQMLESSVSENAPESAREKKLRFSWWTKETLSFPSRSEWFALCSPLLCAIFCYNLQPSPYTSQARERRKREWEAEQIRARTEAQRRKFFSVASSITIVTNSLA